MLFLVGLGASALLHWAFWRNRRQRRGPAPHVVVGQLARRLRARLRGEGAAGEDSEPAGAAPTARRLRDDSDER